MAPVSRVVDLLAQQWGRSSGYVQQPGDHPYEAAMLTLDSSKANRELGWAPRLSLEQATGWSAEWYRAVEAGVDASVISRMQIRQYFQRGESQADTARVAA